MDLAPSESFHALARLRESVRRGDWATVESIATGIRRHRLPPTREGLGEYLRDLKETLIVAKASRANAMASLVRLKAAAGFQSSGRETPQRRQNSAVSTSF
jgi:DTW domain-containing protein YfiP